MTIILWLILFVISWPLALLVLVVYPLAWVLLLPFRSSASRSAVSSTRSRRSSPCPPDYSAPDGADTRTQPQVASTVNSTSGPPALSSMSPLADKASVADSYGNSIPCSV